MVLPKNFPFKVGFIVVSRDGVSGIVTVLQAGQSTKRGCITDKSKRLLSSPAAS